MTPWSGHLLYYNCSLQIVDLEGVGRLGGETRSSHPRSLLGRAMRWSQLDSCHHRTETERFPLLQRMKVGGRLHVTGTVEGHTVDVEMMEEKLDLPGQPR